MIIDRACDCSIKKFMDCLFSQRYKVLVIEGEFTEQEQKDAFEIIYAEYVDLSGMYVTREFELYAYITSLDNRINTMDRFLELQKQFIGQFGVPFIPGLGIIKKYGHSLHWVVGETDLDWFLKKLESIGLRERRYTQERDKKVKELLDLRKKRIKKEHNVLQTRKEFISMLNRLQQNRFMIDKNETTVEDLAVMIKDNRDDVESQRNLQKSKQR